MKTLNVDNIELLDIIKDLTTNNKEVELLVKGNSMLPFFRDNKTIVTLTKVKTLKKYDIILFKYNNKVFLHRIIKITKDNIICRGDALVSKEYITKYDVVSIVTKYKNKKVININSKRYKLRVYLWALLRPIRKLIIKIIK